MQGQVMIFRSPSGELYVNPFSQRPVAIFALRVNSDKRVYDDITGWMDAALQNFVMVEFEGIQESDFSLTILVARLITKFSSLYSFKRAITIAIDFEYHTIYQGRELTPLDLEVAVDELYNETDGPFDPLGYFKNQLKLKPILLCGTDSKDRSVFEIKATNSTTIDKQLREVFTHELSDQPFNAWVYNAKCEFEIIIPVLLRAGYQAVEKFNLYDKVSQVKAMAKGSTYYSLEVLTYRPVYHPDARIYQPLYIKDTYRDLFRLIGSGSLRKNTKDFQVRDYHGDLVEKMDWDWKDPANTPYRDDGTLKPLFVDYCKRDCVCTYHLLRAFNKSVLSADEIAEKDLAKCITAGGIAKRTAINSMMRLVTDQEAYHINNKAFNAAIGLYKAPDEILYDIEKFKAVKGGLGYFNASYYGTTIDKAVYSDISSAYPFIMAIMSIPTYEGLVVDKCRNRVDGEIGSLLIIRIRSLKLRKGYAPIIYDRDLKYMMFQNSPNTYFMDMQHGPMDYPVFSYADPAYDELLAIEEAYDIKFDVVRAYHFQDSGLEFGSYLQKFYKMKQSNKGKNEALVAVAKLILNSSFGKMCQNMYVTKTLYKLIGDVMYTETVQLDPASKEYQKEFRGSALRIIGGFITSMQRTRLARAAHELYLKGKTIYLLATDCIIYSYDDEKTIKRGRLGDFDQEVIERFTGWSQKGYKYIHPDKTDPKERFILHMNGIDSSSFANEAMFDEFGPGQMIKTATSTRISGGSVVIDLQKYFNVQKDNEILLYSDLGRATLISDRG